MILSNKLSEFWIATNAVTRTAHGRGLKLLPEQSILIKISDVKIYKRKPLTVGCHGTIGNRKPLSSTHSHNNDASSDCMWNRHLSRITVPPVYLLHISFGYASITITMVQSHLAFTVEKRVENLTVPVRFPPRAQLPVPHTVQAIN